MKKKNNKEDLTGLAIPAGLLIGLGIGMVVGQVAAGVLIGLGIGFLIMLILKWSEDR